MENALAIQRAGRDKLIQKVIDESKGLDESGNLLYDAPQTVVLMECLAILSSSVRDSTLTPPENGFKYLKRESFRVALLQVSSSISKAFLKADSAMTEIQTALADLPRLFTSTIRVLRGADNEKSKKLLELLQKRIDESMNTCVLQADETTVVFGRVLDEIDELLQATTAADSQNQAENEKCQKEKNKANEQIKQLKTLLEDVKNQHEQSKKDVEKALKDYKEQFGKTIHLGRLILATIIDGFVEFPKIVFLKVLRQKYHPEHSFRSQLMTADREKIQETRDHLEKEREKEEARFAEVKKKRAEFGELLGKLTNLDLQAADLSKVIEYMNDAIYYLGQVQGQWLCLNQFFNRIKSATDHNVVKNTEDFNSYMLLDHELGMESAILAIGYCMKVGNVARVYTRVSKNYIMPAISKVGSQFGLTKFEAEERRKEIGGICNKAIDGVEALVKEVADECQRKFKEDMNLHIQTITDSLARNQITG